MRHIYEIDQKLDAGFRRMIQWMWSYERPRQRNRTRFIWFIYDWSCIAVMMVWLSGETEAAQVRSIGVSSPWHLRWPSTSAAPCV